MREEDRGRLMKIEEESGRNMKREEEGGVGEGWREEQSEIGRKGEKEK